MYDEPRFLPAGDRALIMELGDAIEEKCNNAIRSVVEAVEAQNIEGIEEAVPTYRSILFYYDPLVMDFYGITSTLKKLYDQLDATSGTTGPTLVIPVLYGGEAGPDLGFVASHAHLSEDEAVALHSSRDYLIYMIGFTPGFTYLGGMDDKIATPRLERPREHIPAGSVGIASKQTGIYPIDSPGGWQLIGLTPLKLYDPNREPPILPSVGEHIRFKPITKEEFDAIKVKVDEGAYQPTIIKVGEPA